MFDFISPLPPLSISVLSLISPPSPLFFYLSSRSSLSLFYSALSFSVSVSSALSPYLSTSLSLFFYIFLPSPSSLFLPTFYLYSTLSFLSPLLSLPFSSSPFSLSIYLSLCLCLSPLKSMTLTNLLEYLLLHHPTRYKNKSNEPSWANL